MKRVAVTLAVTLAIGMAGTASANNGHAGPGHHFTPGYIRQPFAPKLHMRLLEMAADGVTVDRVTLSTCPDTCHAAQR